MIRVGVLGAGQLARMMALAGAPLGIHLYCADPASSPCAAPMTCTTQADYTDLDTLKAHFHDVDVITLENENIPLETASALAAFKPFYPSIAALKIAQDRLFEKQYFQQLGIPVAPFAAIDNDDDCQQAADTIGFPALLKTRRFGYDGKGQARVNSLQELITARQELGGAGLILEGFIPFEREVSLIAVRSQQGEINTYPLTENYHQEGILRCATAPYHDEMLYQQATDHAQKLLEAFNYIGVLAIEFFLQDNQLIANEIAPRVHNSGHWTIEGASTSQFENHLRAVCGLPLGSTDAIGQSVMVNCIGEMPSRDHVLSIAHAHYHSYEKEARAKRKVGHVTIHTDNHTELTRAMEKLTL